MVSSIVARRPPKTEPEILRVLQAVWRATDGRPQAWRGLEQVGLSENSIGVQHAVARGLLLIEGGHSVCLTDAGRGLVG